MTARITGVAAGLLMVFGAMTAHAGLLGADVNVTFYFPNMSSLYCDSGNTTVGAGVEYPAGCSGFSPVAIDVTDDRLFVTHSNLAGFASGAFNGFLLSVLSGPPILSATYLGGTLGVTGILVDSGNVWVNFASQGAGTAEIEIGVTTVPEPATLALLGLGLAGLGFSKRRKA